jgi:hypothetical protein
MMNLFVVRVLAVCFTDPRWSAKKPISYLFIIATQQSSKQLPSAIGGGMC